MLTSSGVDLGFWEDGRVGKGEGVGAADIARGVGRGLGDVSGKGDLRVIFICS